MPETKIWDHFSIQIYPLLVGNMASETTFGHWKVVFSWGKGRKMTFSQNPLISRFWASGFWMSILSSANFKKDPPWNIFCLSVHAPATSERVFRWKADPDWLKKNKLTLRNAHLHNWSYLEFSDLLNPKIRSWQNPVHHIEYCGENPSKFGHTP